MQSVRSLALLFVGLAAVPIQAQLADGQFHAPASSDKFDDKTAFAPAPAPGAPKPAGGVPVWSSGVEFGFNGSSGNTDVFNLRLGGYAKRVTDANLFSADLLYGYGKQNGVLTQDKALFNARDEILFGDSPWALFVSNQIEYDSFRAYDFRVGDYAGFAYRLLKTDDVSLRGRLGVGASVQVGTNSELWVPEGLIGLDYDQKLTQRQRLMATVDAYPDLGHAGQYRVRARGAYECLLCPDWGGLTLRLGLQERYDSNPGAAKKRNDLDYFTTLMLKF